MSSKFKEVVEATLPAVETVTSIFAMNPEFAGIATGISAAL